MNKRIIKNEKIENYSGYKIKSGKLDIIKSTNFLVLNKNVGGDAPKEFIKVYEYGKVRKRNTKKWMGYIAKTGQKWYPAESVTEYLLNKIGETIGLDIAESRLAIVGGQIRFMSKYFLKKDEILVHSAEIFAGYLSGDIGFVDEIEKKNLARNLFTFQFVQLAIKKMFPDDYIEIINSFVKLLIFDALVGNNDRHIYNWGVITDFSGKRKPTFSTIYDTTRGLFWNDSEDRLRQITNHPRQLNERLQSYADKSKPKTGWEGAENINHFQFVQFLVNSNIEYKNFLVNLCNQESKIKIFNLIDKKFADLFTTSRLELIKMCLEIRFKMLMNL